MDSRDGRHGNGSAPGGSATPNPSAFVWAAMMASDPRTVVIADTPSLLRGRLITAAMPAWPAKDPTDAATYVMDFTPVLAGKPIVQIDPMVSGTVIVQRALWSGALVSLLLAGGTDGIDSVVTVVLTLADGQQIRRAATMPVMAQSIAPAVDPNALTLNGMPLTIGTAAINASGPDKPVTLVNAPLTIGPEPILLGA